MTRAASVVGIAVVLGMTMAAGAWLARRHVMPAGPSPSPAPEVRSEADDAVAVVEVGDLPGLRVEVLGARRLGRDIVEVRLRLVNRDPTTPIVVGARFAESPDEEGTLSGAVLASEQETKRYFVLRDSAGRPVCSADLARVGPGERREAWVRFVGPGVQAARMTLHLKGLPPVSGIMVPEAS